MEIIKKIKEYFKNSDYLFVLIFGSYAKNDFTNLSDIDIGIYFKDNPNYKEIGYHSLKLEELLNKKIDLIALNDIYKKNPLFSFEILKNHIPIIINNQEEFINFKTKCQLYYLDAKPLIEQNLFALKQRIKNKKFGERNFVI